MKKFLILFILTSIPIIAYDYKDLSDNWKNVDYFANYYFKGLSSADSLNIITSGNLYEGDGPVIRLSTDGGNNWRTVWADTSIFYFDSLGHPHYSYKPKYHVESIAFPGKELILAGFTRGRMLRSTDMGIEWDTLSFNSIKAIRTINMIDTKFGAALNDTNILITQDGGLSWRITQLPDTAVRKQMFEMQTTSLGNILIIAAGYFGTSYESYFYKTSDFGENWSRFPTDSLAYKIYFFNDSLGWAGGGYSVTDTVKHHTDKFGRISHTTDGGKTWAIQLNMDDTLKNDNDSIIRENEYFYSISFTDSLNGIATNVTAIWRTYDGGKSWVKQTKQFLAGTDYLEEGPNLTSFKQGNAIVTSYQFKIFKYFLNGTHVDDDIEMNINENDIFISPIPATDFLEINLPIGNTEENVEIFSVLGVEMKNPPRLTSSGTPPEGNLRIDVSVLPPGVYFVRVGDRVGKFVKI